MNRLICANRCYINTIKSHLISSPQIVAPKRPVQCNLFIYRGAHDQRKKIRSTLNYMIAVGVMTVGLSYAAVPLYRIFCQVSHLTYKLLKLKGFINFLIPGH